MTKTKANEIRTRYYNLGREACKPTMSFEQQKAIVARYRKLSEEFIGGAQ